MSAPIIIPQNQYINVVGNMIPCSYCHVMVLCYFVFQTPSAFTSNLYKEIKLPKTDIWFALLALNTFGFLTVYDQHTPNCLWCLTKSMDVSFLFRNMDSLSVEEQQLLSTFQQNINEFSKSGSLLDISGVKTGGLKINKRRRKLFTRSRKFKQKM